MIQDSEGFDGAERREFMRLDCASPLAYKVCKEETLTMILAGYTVNVSEAGLLCSLKNKVKLADVLWLSFDKSVLYTCERIEKRSLIYQNGVIGRVVRIDDRDNGTFDVGIRFLTREEKHPIAAAL